MMKRACLILILGLMVYTTTARAAEQAPPADKAVIPAKADFKDLRPMGAVSVRRVIDALRIELADGRIVQLSGIDVPGMDAQEPGDMAVAAFTFLKDLLEGKQVSLYQTKDPENGRTNRMSYTLAQMERQDGPWIQGLLLANGLARVYPSTRNPEMAVQMMGLENAARDGKRGLWSDLKYAVLSPETAENGMHQMAVVQGTVRSASIYNNRIFLNFGADWRTDFTIGITPAIRRKFNTIGLNPLDFGGKTVRVHGWVEKYYGPYIDLTDPVWLEILP